MKPRVRLKYALPLVLLLALAGGWWWWARSPDFYHQPASYRYRMNGGKDQALLAQWRARGPEGIQELTRRVPVGNHYFGEKYQSFVLWLLRKNLPNLVSWLPASRVSERIMRSCTCVDLLADLGPDACTPQTVAAMVKEVQDSNSPLRYSVVNCLSGWGRSASNALPALLKVLRNQTQNGRSARSSISANYPDYARALACVGVNSKEALIELLSVNTNTWASDHAITWCRNSSQAPVILAELVTNQAVKMEIRESAIGLADACGIASLLPGVAATLTEPKLVNRWPIYLQHMEDKAAPYCAPILNQIAALSIAGVTTNVVPNSTNKLIFALCKIGRPRAEELFPIMLTHAWDEQWPFVGSLAWPNQPRNLHCDFAAHLRVLAPDPEVYQNLILSGLAHSDWRVRAGAAEQARFSELSLREIDALAKCLRDENATVRAIAAQLLLRVEAHRPEALKETWAVITNQTLPFRRRICAIGSVRGEWLSAGDKLEAAKILDTLAEEPEAELRNRALAKQKELKP